MTSDAGELAGALALARLGDEAGFLRLWRALQPRLLRYLLVLGCADADDIASETWLQVVRDLPGFIGGEPEFRGWLFTIGRHRAIDAARARARRPASPMDPTDPAVEATLADDQQVEQQVIDGMSTAAAVRLLSRLSPDQAEAVALRVLAGLETSDAARILGKSAGSVRVALHRGLKALAADPAIRAMAATGVRAAAGAVTDPNRAVLGEVDW